MPNTINTVVLPASGDLSTAPAGPLHNHYHRCAQNAAAQATAYAILCGLELQRVRSEIAKPGKRNDLPNADWGGSGGWEKWVKDNCEFTPETARKYIAVSEGIKSKLTQVHTAKTLPALLDVAPSSLDESSREQLLKSVSKVTEGQTLQQLYMDFGITKKDPQANLRKGGATHHNGRPSKVNLDNADAEMESLKIIESIALFFKSGQHQILTKSQLLHFDQQLMGAREVIRPFIK